MRSEALSSAVLRPSARDAATPAAALTPVTVIDLDRTLTRNSTYSPFLLHVARNHAPWRLMLVPAVLGSMAAYKLHLMKRKQLKETMHRLMIGPRLSRAKAEPLATAFAKRQLARNCYAQGRALIARETAEGRLVIMATAAPRLYAATIAAGLGIEHVVASDARWEGDRLVPGIAGANCYGPEKLARIAHYLAALDLPRAAISLRVYSDDLSDRPIFDWSDEQIAVNPSAKLRAVAVRRGWRVLDWRLPRS